jgi:hypothetical protein
MSAASWPLFFFCAGDSSEHPLFCVEYSPFCSVFAFSPVLQPNTNYCCLLLPPGQEVALVPPASRATQSPSPSLPPVIFPPLPAPLPLLPPQALSRDLQQPSATSPSLVLLQLSPLCCVCQALEGPVKFTSCGKSPPARHTAQRSQGVGGDTRLPEGRGGQERGQKAMPWTIPGGVVFREQEDWTAPPLPLGSASHSTKEVNHQ